jgi:hypothetical protein
LYAAIASEDLELDDPSERWVSVLRKTLEDSA